VTGLVKRKVWPDQSKKIRKGPN
jgi:hypothetical protein